MLLTDVRGSLGNMAPMLKNWTLEDGVIAYGAREHNI